MTFSTVFVSHFYGVFMRAAFNLKREMKNELVYGLTEDYQVDIHFHSHIELFFVMSGQIEVFLNDQCRVLGSKEGSIAFSYDTHGYRKIGDAEAFYLIIPRSWCADILPIIDNRHATSQFLKSEATFDVVLNAVKHLCDHPNEISKRGYIYAILGAALDELVPKSEEANTTFAPEILIYVSRHFRDDLSLVALAKKFGYNPSYLSRSFRANFGISFCKYVTMLRLREAVMLISSGEKSITECAIESGFGSTKSFYRAFREEFGMPPKEYLSK